MGYTTDFKGRFAVNRPLYPSHVAYLLSFANSRRMKRDPEEADLLPNRVRNVVGLPIGPEGAYFTGGGGFKGQDTDKSVLDQNQPPQGQPGLWCQWVPTDDGRFIIWDGNEKFYDYVEWLQYLIDHFLKPWGYTLNGTVTWQGEESEDAGTIYVRDNEVTVTKHYGKQVLAALDDMPFW